MWDLTHQFNTLKIVEKDVKSKKCDRGNLDLVGNGLLSDRL